MKPCLYCKSKTLLLPTPVFDRLDVSKKPWYFAKCTHCQSLILLDPPLDTAPFYPENYHLAPPKDLAFWGQLYLALQNYNYAYRHSILKRHIQDRLLRSVLDIGCGPAYDLQRFHEKGIKVLGLDQDKATCTRLSQCHDIPTFNGTLEMFTERHTTRFDLILANAIVEHIPDVQLFFEKVRKHLVDKGLFFIGVPLADSFQARLFGLRWSGVTEAPRHLSLPTQNGIETIAKTTGFSLKFFEGDSAIQGAGIAALSMFPRSSRSHDSFSLINIGQRLLGMGSMMFFSPFTFIENRFNRPAAGYFLFEKL